MWKKTLAVGALFVLPLWSAGSADKTKKAYELIYEDVQVLKKQIQDISDQIQKNEADLQLIKDQIKELADVVRRSQSDQISLREDVKIVPAQYQALSGKIEQLSIDLAKLSDSILFLKNGASPGSVAPSKPEERETRKPEKKPEEQSQRPAQAPSNIAPQDIYNMAYNDYLKGNFDLAVQGFTMYKDQFPDSPLADNALYWTGECHYSQRKFNDAISVFNELILTYPQGDKVPAAFLKKGMSFAESGKKEEALAAFKLLITKFPLEEETRMAQQKIKELAEK